MPKIFVADATKASPRLLRMQQTALPLTAPTIDLAALRSRQQANPRLVLVEALPAPYFASGHLPGAINLPHDAPDAVVRATLADPDAEIVTYCASATCPNSHVLAARLRRLGYSSVAVFGEGKAGWRDAGLAFKA
jgi:rhodanese-related sulfurtransferase